MKIQQLTADEALRSLQSESLGLSREEAARGLVEFGPNRVERIAGEPLLLRLLREFTHFFALILWIAAALAFIAELNDPGKGMATLGAAVVAVIAVNALFSFWQEYRAEKAFAALQELLPHEVQVLRDGAVAKTATTALVPGDVILLEEGDDVPADCRLVEAFGVRVNNAMVPALGLGAEPPAADVMRRRPRSARDRLVTGALVARAYLFLGILEAVAAMAAFFFVLRGGGWTYGQVLGPNQVLYLQATTACLSAIIVMQVVNVYECRSERRSAFSSGILGNRLIVAGVMVEAFLLLLIVYTPWGNRVFGTAPIPASVWGFIVPFALAMLALEELRKTLNRRSAPEHPRPTRFAGPQEAGAPAHAPGPAFPREARGATGPTCRSSR